MYSKNTGNSGQNLQLFSGQGCWFNGIDMQITVPVNATVLTEIKRVNGSVVLNTSPQIITNYVIGTGASAVHTDYFLFTDVLTADEIALYSKNPNQFFQNVQDGVIGNCVLNMPLHGVDKYQVDYSRYNVGLVNADVTLSNSPPTGANTITKNGNVFTLTNTVAELYNYQPNVRFYPLVYGTSLYTVKIKVKCISGTAYVGAFEGTPKIILNKVLTAGQEYTYESATRFSNIGGQKGSLTFDGLNYTNFTVEVTVEVYKLVAGVNEVINYTVDCVTLAKQLPYGSQEANFFHKSSGVPIRTGLSPFFESTPYWDNYGNTGYLLTDSSVIFELITYIDTNSKVISVSGNYDANRLYLGTSNGGRAFMRYGEISQTKTVTSGFYLLTIVANKENNNISFYVNGILLYSSIYSFLSTGVVYIGGVSPTIYLCKEPIRHFKVITDAKTINNYDALVEYNKYQSQGLLNE